MRRFILSLILVAAAVSAAGADTIIPGGNVSGFWTRAGSPYIITGNAAIPDGQVFMIGPGVRIQFNPGVSLTVQGSLRADGTLQPGVGDTIYFTGNSGNPAGQIHISNADDTVRFTFCALECGVWMGINNEVVVAEDCRLSSSFSGDSDNLILNRCLITTNWQIYYNYYLHAHKCQFTRNFSGSEGTAGAFFDSCLVEGNITFTSQGALYFTNSTLRGNFQGRNDNESSIHFTNSTFYGDCESGGYWWLDHCTLYGQMNAGSWLPIYVYIQNGCVFYNSLSFSSINLTISNSLFMRDVYLNGYNKTLLGNVFCDSVWGNHYMLNFILADNFFIGGNLSLTIGSDPINIRHNVFINSPTTALKLVNVIPNPTSLHLASNTIYRAAGNGIQVIDQTTGAQQINLSNNIVAFCDQIGIIQSGIEQIQSTYSNVFDNALGNYSGVTPGTGSLSVDPAFVDTSWGDCRLSWGSPCIDDGDPTLLDPDGTRSDMGAFCFDQSHPVRVLLTPHGQPLRIPEFGGSIDFDLRLTNIVPATQSVGLWCNVTWPDGRISSPVLGPLNAVIPGNITLSRVRTQTIPAPAPSGPYHYTAYAVALGDTSLDSFIFVKLGSGISDSGFGSWANSGQDFSQEAIKNQIQPSSFPEGTHASRLHPGFPNPFNPATAINYELGAASHVSLKVYDTAGRWVTTLVEGWRGVGKHEVPFDGTKLASGLYLVRMQAAQFTAVQKVVLIK